MNEQLSIDWTHLSTLEQGVKGSESTGIHARWEFGCYLRDHVPRGFGGRGKTGPLALIADELLISERELQRRRQFAVEYPTEEKLRQVMTEFTSWYEIVTEALGSPRKPRVLPPQPELPDGQYPILYCDPPWRYDFVSTPKKRAVELHYPTMSLDEIKTLDVPAADDAILFLWATSPKLEESLEVVNAWDFTYRTNMVWVKDRIGMGYYARQQHELLLICRRGHASPPDETSLPASVVHAPRGKHSEKPAEFYEIIERLYPGYSKVELFAREAREGWQSWGNEVVVAA